jgi:hypothetical protein
VDAANAFACAHRSTRGAYDGTAKVAECTFPAAPGGGTVPAAALGMLSGSNGIVFVTSQAQGHHDVGGFALTSYLRQGALTPGGTSAENFAVTFQ